MESIARITSNDHKPDTLALIVGKWAEHLSFVPGFELAAIQILLSVSGTADQGPHVKTDIAGAVCSLSRPTTTRLIYALESNGLLGYNPVKDTITITAGGAELLGALNGCLKISHDQLA